MLRKVCIWCHHLIIGLVLFLVLALHAALEVVRPRSFSIAFFSERLRAKLLSAGR